GSTQCATVSTRSGASAVPVQKFPREPTISTTELATPGGALAAPPTIAGAACDETMRQARAMSARGMRAHQPRGASDVNDGPETMPSILLTGPAVEPVTLAEAKLFLRVEHDDDDDLIAALVAGSRIHVEAQTRRALITQTWRLTRDAWPRSGRFFVL